MPVGGGHGQMSRGLFSGCGQSLYRNLRSSAARPPTRHPKCCSCVRSPARTARRCERQAELGGLQRSRATGQVRTSPARPWSRRRSGLPASSESGYRLHVIPFEPELITEPSDGVRLDALRRRLGDTSCKQRGHMTAIVSRAVPRRISVRRADACNPAARSDRAIGSARRATRSQTCSPRLRRHLARDKLRLHAIQQRLQPLPLFGFGHEVAVGTRADQAQGSSRWIRKRGPPATVFSSQPIAYSWTLA